MTECQPWNAGDAVTRAPYSGRSGKDKKQNYSVVAFGDSITRSYGVPAGKGWVELLPERLRKKGKKMSLCLMREVTEIFPQKATNW